MAFEYTVQRNRQRQSTIWIRRFREAESMRIMRRILCVLLIGDFLHGLSVALKDTPTLGSEGSPRVLSQGQVHRFHRLFYPPRIE